MESYSEQYYQMPKVCEHFSSLKWQKVCQNIRGAALKCSNIAKHSKKEQNLWVCLTCGYVGCSRYSELKCAQQHFTKDKHKLTGSLTSNEIYCYECDQMYSEIVEVIQTSEQVLSKTQTDKFQKMKEWKEKIEGELIMRHVSKSSAMEIEPTTKSTKNSKLYPEGMEQENEKGTGSKVIGLVNTKPPKSTISSGKTLKTNSVFGLNNLGNTCFFNSTLQSLFATKALHQTYYDIDFTKQQGESEPASKIDLLYDELEPKYIYKGNIKEYGTGVMSINQRFKRFLSDAAASNGSVYSPNDIFSGVCAIKSKFKSMAQQDAQQLLRYLMEALVQGEIYQLGINRHKMRSVESKYGKLKLTYMDHVFGSYLASRLYCLSCKNVSWTLDLCLDLSIEIVREKYNDIPLPSGTAIPRQQIGADGLQYPQANGKTPGFLSYFFAAEQLGKQNYFNCEKCKASKAIKKLYLKDPPRILTIVIKRFTNGLQKNNAHIDFPEELNLSEVSITPGNWNYRVYAIVVHGGSVYGGHYTAYTRRGNSWYYFSDSHFKQTSWESVRGSQAYILFYERIQ